MSEATRAQSESASVTPRATRRDPEARAKRDALRAQILQSLETRSTTDSGSSPSLVQDERPSSPGTLRDRIGGREALAELLNRDFMPLADECIEQARERDPELVGMLAINLEAVADEELGGVVESVEAADINEVNDPLLLECVRESALSMMLPPPPESGREELMISVPIEHEE